MSNEINQSSNKDFAIIANGINKNFKIYHEKNDSVFSFVSNPFSKKNQETINILKDISFNLKKGEVLGVIGLNGSGKTTLLKILSGILKPDTGEIKINGTIAP
jgi:ABC-type polysaccharide/polyol phosphate transport system ATPase subunit